MYFHVEDDCSSDVSFEERKEKIMGRGEKAMIHIMYTMPLCAYHRYHLPCLSTRKSQLLSLVETMRFINLGARSTTHGPRCPALFEVLRLVLGAAALLIILADGIPSCEAWSSSPEPQQSKHVPSTKNRRSFVRDSLLSSGLIAATTISSLPDPVGAAGIPFDDKISSPKANSKIYYPEPGSLIGKTMIVTGANTGLGLESAKRLAAAGACVVVTARSSQKCQSTVQQINEYLSDIPKDQVGKVYSAVLSLDDLDSVRQFPKQLDKVLGGNSTTITIDCLMNNAGVAFLPERKMTKDGYELTFQTNHLGPFLLTADLFPYLNRKDGAGIINVASQAHNFAVNSQTGKQGLNFENLNSELSFDGWHAYSATKLENILMAQELQRRADAAGLKWLECSSLHPGVIGTDIWRTSQVSRESNSNNLIQKQLSKAFYSNVKGIEEGSNTQVWLAAMPEADYANSMKGGYFDEDRNLVKNLPPFAQDREVARKLWETSEEMLGIEFKP